MLKRPLIATLMIGSVAIAAPPTLNLTLQDALRKGLDYNPDVKKSDSLIKNAQDDLAKERGLLFPAINGSATAANKQNSALTGGSGTGTSGTSISAPTSSGATAPAGGTGSLSTAAPAGGSGDTYTVQLSLTQPLYAGGALTSGLAYYKANEDLARQAFFSKKQDVANQILTAYYKYVQNQQLLEAAQQNREILKAYLDITNHYTNIGRSRRMDKLQAAVNYSLSLANVEAIRTTLVQAQADLKKLLGSETNYLIRADFRVVINPVDNISVDDAFEAGLKNNPTVRTDQITVEQVEYAKTIDLASDLPSMSLVGNAGYTSPDIPELFQNNTSFYAIGVNLTVPIFSGLSSLAKRAGYGEKKYQGEKQLQLDKDILRDQIEQTIEALRSAREQLAFAQDSVKEGRDALELANRGYAQGTASSTDVITLQATRYNAEQLFVNTQFTYLQSLVTLREAMGIDLEKAYVH